MSFVMIEYVKFEKYNPKFANFNIFRKYEWMWIFIMGHLEKKTENA